jgi:outer membrane protein OmpA-like peptidoglycan-associated protein
MKKYLTLFLVLLVITCYGQSGIKKADRLFKENSMIAAAEVYNEAIDNTNDISIETLLNAATANYEIGKYQKAAGIYSRAISQGISLNNQHIYNYVRALRGNSQYDRANEVYLEHLELTNSTEAKRQHLEQVKAFDSISKTKQTNKYDLKNLPINTSYAEFAPVEYNGKLIFSSSRPGASKKVYDRTEQPFLSLYSTSVNNEEYTDVKLFSEEINSLLHDATIAFSPNSKVIYYTSNLDSDKSPSGSDQKRNFQLYRAQLDNRIITNKQKLFINVENYSVGHPFVSADNQYLFFASDMPGGFGEADIYYCKIFEDGSLSDPINAGSTINTYGNDFTPFLSADGTFYFASNGHVGYGGLDIYKAKFNGQEGKFSSLYNVGSSLNTVADDFSFSINEDNSKGYIASNRAGGKGDDDIYSFQIAKTIENQTLDGMVYDAENKKVLSNAIIYIKDENGNALETTRTNEGGSYSVTVSSLPNYEITVSAMDYYVQSKKLELNPDEMTKSQTIDFYLKSPKDMIISSSDGMKQIKLDPIYFEYDKAIIQKISESTLDKVVELMNYYPEMKIRIESHTDSRGSDLYNLKLSMERAKASMTYLISQGIIKDRILSAEGFGEYRLINKCDNNSKCTDEQHAVNRRSTFIIVE